MGIAIKVNNIDTPHLKVFATVKFMVFEASTDKAKVESIIDILASLNNAGGTLIVGKPRMLVALERVNEYTTSM